MGRKENKRKEKKTSIYEAKAFTNLGPNKEFIYSINNK